jgi:hypothetical protein
VVGEGDALIVDFPPKRKISMSIENKDPPNPTKDESTDPFADLSKLRLSQDFPESAGVKKLLTTVPVRRPRRQEFVRAHPDPTFRAPFAIIELEEDGERYLVKPELAAAIPTEIVTEMLYTTTNRQNVLFLWPVRLPSSDGRVIDWHRTAQQAVELAIKRWIRVTGNMSLRAYEIYEGPESIPDPIWPDEYTFHDLLRVAFRDRLISHFDHPVLKQLRGE